MFGSTSQPAEEESDSEDNEEENVGAVEDLNEPVPPARSIEDEFNFADYDNETTQPALKISDVVEVTENDQIADDSNDSEAEDDLIKPEDNLILVGRVEVDCASLEVYSKFISY